jgi:hypothetical protein
MSKDQEYSPLIGEASDDVEEESLQKSSWTFKISRTLLAGLLAAETLLLAVALYALFKQKNICTVPLKSNRVLYCAYYPPPSSTLCLIASVNLAPALEAVENQVQVYHVGFPGLK